MGLLVAFNPSLIRVVAFLRQLSIQAIDVKSSGELMMTWNIYKDLTAIKVASVVLHKVKAPVCKRLCIDRLLSESSSDEFLCLFGQVVVDYCFTSYPKELTKPPQVALLTAV